MGKLENRKKQLQRMRTQRFTGNDDPHVKAANSLYYYVWGVGAGKRLCLGPYSTEEEAWDMMYSKNIEGEVFGLRTRDQSAATRILKAKSLNDSRTDIETAIQRVRHKGKDINL